jgi:hypothetical protein
MLVSDTGDAALYQCPEASDAEVERRYKEGIAELRRLK